MWGPHFTFIAFLSLFVVTVYVLFVVTCVAGRQEVFLFAIDFQIFYCTISEPSFVLRVHMLNKTEKEYSFEWFSLKLQFFDIPAEFDAICQRGKSL